MRESRCICGWRTPAQGESDSIRLFDEHVASGECPEERDADGNILFEDGDCTDGCADDCMADHQGEL